MYGHLFYDITNGCDVTKISRSLYHPMARGVCSMPRVAFGYGGLVMRIYQFYREIVDNVCPRSG